jgi:dimeric dUTPase (all-alpha-NTP-PPase superfamily)
VDVVHFIGNMLVSLDCSDEEWEDAYQQKQRINRRRQIAGYSARKEQS